MNNAVKSYHAHVYYNDDETGRAENVRLKLQTELPGEVKVHGLVARAIGPHPRPMFEVDFQSSRLHQIKEWFEKNNDGLSVMIHPITGDHVKDHQDLSVWVGKKLDLKLDFFNWMRRWKKPEALS
jgi:aromatic ring-cleaving dioxygenase